MSAPKCICGRSVKALRMAAHLRGNDHRCRLEQLRAEETGRVMLPGANGSTALALEARGIDFASAGSWRPGAAGTQGYESTVVYVRPAQIATIAAWSGAVADALAREHWRRWSSLPPAIRAVAEDAALERV
jgi:hypothetical protein